jgi:phytoene/squalene synthetase
LPSTKPPELGTTDGADRAALATVTRVVERISLAARRPWLLARGALANRDAPNLERLRSIEDPERFLWAILPHAARTFAVSLILLPAHQARSAAVAYLYCRMLDSYEDLHPDHVAKREVLAAIAARPSGPPLAAAPPLPEAMARDRRDRAHLLLVKRRSLIDRVFLTLPSSDQENVAELVSSMAAGMLWAADAFEAQGGVLETEEQLSRYCHHVIGEPVLFALRLVSPGGVTEARRRDAMAVSEMIQLANITRDIERDAERGIAYHPALRPLLSGAWDGASWEAVRSVREELLVRALGRASAYRRLVQGAGFERFSGARAAAVSMLLFTDRYYRSCAAKVGRHPWRGLNRTSALTLASALAAVSPRFSTAVVARVEGDFLAAAAAIATHPHERARPDEGTGSPQIDSIARTTGARSG